MWLTAWEIIKYYTPFLEPATDVYRLNTDLLIFSKFRWKICLQKPYYPWTNKQTSSVLWRKRVQYNTHMPIIKTWSGKKNSMFSYRDTECSDVTSHLIIPTKLPIKRGLKPWSTKKSYWTNKLCITRFLQDIVFSRFDSFYWAREFSLSGIQDRTQTHHNQ